MNYIRNYIRIISDIHGDHKRYKELTDDCCYSIQLGDLGLRIGKLHELGIDHKYHKFIGGNHEYYDEYAGNPYVLGDRGVYFLGNSRIKQLKFFFLRGAYSIDKSLRTPQVDWFEEEELSFNDMTMAFHHYKFTNNKEILITHEAPSSIVKQIGNPRMLEHFGLSADFESRTQTLLEVFYDYKRPRYHFFGHHHKNIDIESCRNGNIHNVICREPGESILFDSTLTEVFENGDPGREPYNIDEVPF